MPIHTHIHLTPTSSFKERSSPMLLYSASPGHSTWCWTDPSAFLALHCARVPSDCEGPAAAAGDEGNGDVTGIVGRRRSGDILTIAGALDFALSWLALRCVLLSISSSSLAPASATTNSRIIVIATDPPMQSIRRADMTWSPRTCSSS